MSKMAGAATPGEVAAAICAVPDAQWVLASDSGQISNPLAPEALASTCCNLTSAGVERGLVSRMIRENPRELLAV